MIESIQFTNFKALRKTRLSLAPFTLLLGPNGSGKTSVLQALRYVALMAVQGVDSYGNMPNPTASWASLLSVTENQKEQVAVNVRFRLKQRVFNAIIQWHSDNQTVTRRLNYENGSAVPAAEAVDPLRWLGAMQTFALDPASIAQPIFVNSAPLQQNGSGLPAVLDDLKDNHTDRWELLLKEMRHWLPEYDQIQFDKPQQGQKGIVLRTKRGGHRIPANELSQGTLVALALLTLAYLPNPPTVVGLEEIDRAMHPRLLRHLQDALYRLSYPASCGESRPPIQVIATTHSPYLLDFYRDHPEEVVLAQKEGLEVEMKRLSDIDHYQDIIGDSPLSEVWYSGVLGGVSVKP